MVSPEGLVIFAHVTGLWVLDGPITTLTLVELEHQTFRLKGEIFALVLRQQMHSDTLINPFIFFTRRWMSHTCVTNL